MFDNPTLTTACNIGGICLNLILLVTAFMKSKAAEDKMKAADRYREVLKEQSDMIDERKQLLDARDQLMGK